MKKQTKAQLETENAELRAKVSQLEGWVGALIAAQQATYPPFVLNPMPVNPYPQILQNQPPFDWPYRTTCCAANPPFVQDAQSFTVSGPFNGTLS